MYIKIWYSFLLCFIWVVKCISYIIKKKRERVTLLQSIYILSWRTHGGVEFKFSFLWRYIRTHSADLKTDWLSSPSSFWLYSTELALIQFFSKNNLFNLPNFSAHYILFWNHILRWSLALCNQSFWRYKRLCLITFSVSNGIFLSM